MSILAWAEKAKARGITRSFNIMYRERSSCHSTSVWQQISLGGWVRGGMRGMRRLDNPPISCPRPRYVVRWTLTVYVHHTFRRRRMGVKNIFPILLLRRTFRRKIEEEPPCMYRIGIQCWVFRGFSKYAIGFFLRQQKELIEQKTLNKMFYFFAFSAAKTTPWSKSKA